jgi:hypothetical protein
MNYLYIAFTVGLLSLPLANGAEQGKHLFILSGQSNMVRLDPDISFTPAVIKEFGKDRVIVVKDAYGGQSIRHWYKRWESTKDETVNSSGDLYVRLINKVNLAIKDKEIITVTFIWMQGERDAAEGYGEVYEDSFKGLMKQLKVDLNRNDINFVIGRISDFDINNNIYKHWTRIREIQVDLAESNLHGKWLNTDDLNDGLDANGNEIKNGLHYSIKGYWILGNRFAEKAIELIRSDNCIRR